MDRHGDNKRAIRHKGFPNILSELMPLKDRTSLFSQNDATKLTKIISRFCGK